MLLKLMVTFIMMIGLALTLVPRIPGTVVILLGALIYGVFTSFATSEPWVWTALLALMATAEIGGRGLRILLTRSFSLTRPFSVNSTVGNVGGIIAADALLGPVVGLVVWEILVGKTLLPRWNTIAKILFRLAIAATFRLLCGLVMFILVLVYIFL